MPRRYYSNTFAPTTLTGAINSAVTTLSVGSTAGGPASFPWTGVIDRGQGTEELVTVLGVVGLTLTVIRGVDGRSPQPHDFNAPFEHVSSARDFDETNSHVNAASAVHGLVGSPVDTSGGSVITASGPAVKGLVVKSAAAQTANLFESQNSAGTVEVAIPFSGGLVTAKVLHAGGINGALGSTIALAAQSLAANQSALVVRGFAAQTANLTEFQNSAGSVVAKVLPSGAIESTVGLTASRWRTNGDLGSGFVGALAGTLEIYFDGTKYHMPFHQTT